MPRDLYELGQKVWVNKGAPGVHKKRTDEEWVEGEVQTKENTTFRGWEYYVTYENGGNFIYLEQDIKPMEDNNA